MGSVPRVLEVLASHLRNSDKLCPSLNQLLCETSARRTRPTTIPGETDGLD